MNTDKHNHTKIIINDGSNISKNQKITMNGQFIKRNIDNSQFL